MMPPVTEITGVQVILFQNLPLGLWAPYFRSPVEDTLNVALRAAEHPQLLAMSSLWKLQVPSMSEEQT